jgi:hypothetical protein
LKLISLRSNKDQNFILDLHVYIYMEKLLVTLIRSSMQRAKRRGIEDESAAQPFA